METTLFDRFGMPSAYIVDDNENTVFAWSGHAVASIENCLVWGWNGFRLGFYDDGVMYDVRGQRVGSTAGKSMYAVQPESEKPGRFARYEKREKGSEQTLPSFSSAYVDKTLDELLAQGAIRGMAAPRTGAASRTRRFGVAAEAVPFGAGRSHRDLRRCASRVPDHSTSPTTGAKATFT